MAIEINLKGAKGALKDLSALPALMEQAAVEAVNATAKATRAEAIRLTTQTYNLSEDDLGPFVDFNPAGKTPSAGASVTLKVRAIPISAFNPTVRMIDYTLKSRAGRTYTRELPTIWVKRFRNGSEKQFNPFFPLRQRDDGALSTADMARRRINKSTDPEQNRHNLTQARFYTFPKRFLKEIKPKLRAFVGEHGSLQLKAAVREHYKHLRVLKMRVLR